MLDGDKEHRWLIRKLQPYSISLPEYQISLVFENGGVIVVNLHSLIGEYVAENDLDSARIDAQWGCLEFRNGAVNIDPVNLAFEATPRRMSP